ncbi:MAG: 50S ribosomal protein L3, partial [Gammaproteobacteria bacterium]|nr:50S ribosomal protein L3 [Gammaproteobacteria bacterium]
MAIGIVGVKKGMTRVFSEDGASLPVTVIEVTPNRVVQRKTAGSDGYEAIQVAFGSTKAS